MEKQLYELEQSITALRCAATGIAAAMENESISGEEVYCLLSSIADGMISRMNAKHMQS